MLPAALNAVGPADHRDLENREDVLCYTPLVLSEAVEVTGHLSLVLHIASSARDTHLASIQSTCFLDGRVLPLSLTGSRAIPQVPCRAPSSLSRTGSTR
jgi:uncharacterized protein